MHYAKKFAIYFVAALVAQAAIYRIKPVRDFVTTDRIGA